LPWIDGIFTYLIPAWSTAAMVDGRCLRFMKWPTTAMFSAYTITMMLWHYVIPTAFFFFAYGRIIGVIRRQSRVVGPAEASASASYSTQPTRGGATTGHGQKHHSSQTNVVRTMVIIVLCFCVCYLPYKVLPRVLVTSRYLPYNVYDTSPPASLNLILKSSSSRCLFAACCSASNV